MDHAWHLYPQDWHTERVCPQLEIRQFEFGAHPETAAYAACGTVKGCSALINHAVAGGRVVAAVRQCGVAKADSVLGLCWLRRTHTHYIAGSAKGAIRMIDTRAAIELDHDMDADGGADMDDHYGGVSAIAGAAHESSAAQSSMLVPELPVVHSYPTFDQLTCVHVNSMDTYLLASGYSHDVQVVDVSTGAVVRTFKDAHTKHINITRFAHASPNVFASSSFDHTVKVWDMRVGRGSSQTPLYTITGSRGNVTLSFSPDDQYLLTAAVDNDVREHTAVDGRLYARLQIPETGRHDNYTRAYFIDAGTAVVSGSSEESVVRVHNAATGELAQTMAMYDGRPNNTLYVQSLRGHPLRAGYICVLVNFRDAHFPMHMVRLDTTRALHDNTAAATSQRVAGAAASAASHADDAGEPAPPRQDTPTSQVRLPLYAAPSPVFAATMWSLLADAQEDNLALDRAMCAQVDQSGSIRASAPTADTLPASTPSMSLFASPTARRPVSTSGCDVVIVLPAHTARHIRLHAHEAILRARIPLFARLFPRLPAREHAPAVISFSCAPQCHLTPAVLSTLLAYAYTDGLHPCGHIPGTAMSVDLAAPTSMLGVVASLLGADMFYSECIANLHPTHAAESHQPSPVAPLSREDAGSLLNQTRRASRIRCIHSRAAALGVPGGHVIAHQAEGPLRWAVAAQAPRSESAAHVAARAALSPSSRTASPRVGPMESHPMHGPSSMRSALPSSVLTSLPDPLADEEMFLFAWDPFEAECSTHIDGLITQPHGRLQRFKRVSHPSGVDAAQEPDIAGADASCVGYHGPYAAALATRPLAFPDTAARLTWTHMHGSLQCDTGIGPASTTEAALPRRRVASIGAEWEPSSAPLGPARRKIGVFAACAAALHAANVGGVARLAELAVWRLVVGLDGTGEIRVDNFSTAVCLALVFGGGARLPESLTASPQTLPAAVAANRLLSWLAHFAVAHYRLLADLGQLDHLRHVSTAAPPGTLEQRVAGELAAFLQRIDDGYMACISEQEQEQEEPSLESIATSSVMNVLTQFHAALRSPTTAASTRGGSGFGRSPPPAAPMSAALRRLTALLRTHAGQLGVLPGAAGEAIPWQLRARYRALLRRIALKPHEDPLLCSSAAPWVPRCTWQHAVLTGRVDAHAFKQSTWTTSQSVLYIGGQAEAHYVPFKSMLSLDAGAATRDESAQDAARGSPGSCGVWSRVPTVGASPSMLINFASAGLTLSASRFVLVYPGCITHTNDYGPGSTGWIVPPAGAAATSVSMASSGVAHLDARPLPASLTASQRHSVNQSRIFVYDSWRATWFCVSPAWRLPWEFYGGQRVDLSASSVEVEPAVAAEIDAPCARTGHTMTAMQATGDVFVDGLRRAVAGTIPPDASGDLVYRHVVFGGYSQPNLMGMRNGGEPLNDVFLLRTRVRADSGPDGVRIDFQWLPPRIHGAAPPARLAHAACYLPLGDDEGGGALMIVGGAGTGRTYGDVAILAPTGPSALGTETYAWHRPVIFGRPMTPRYGHSITSLSEAAAGDAARSTADVRARIQSDLASHTAILFGGRSMGIVHNDVHVITCVKHGDGYIVHWSSPLIQPGPCAGPGARERATMTYAPLWSTSTKRNNAAGAAAPSRDRDAVDARSGAFSSRAVSDTAKAQFLDLAVNVPSRSGAGQLRAAASAARCVPGAILIFGGHTDGVRHGQRRRDLRAVLRAGAAMHAAEAEDNDRSIDDVAALARAAADAGTEDVQALVTSLFEGDDDLSAEAAAMDDGDEEDQDEKCVDANIYAAELTLAPHVSLLAPRGRYGYMGSALVPAQAGALSALKLAASEAASSTPRSAMEEYWNAADALMRTGAAFLSMFSPRSAARARREAEARALHADMEDDAWPAAPAEESTEPRSAESSLAELQGFVDQALANEPEELDDEELRERLLGPDAADELAGPVPPAVRAQRARLRPFALRVHVALNWTQPACRVSDPGVEHMPTVSQTCQVHDLAALAPAAVLSRPTPETSDLLASSDFALLPINPDGAAEHAAEPASPMHLQVECRPSVFENPLRSFRWLLRARCPAFSAMLGGSSRATSSSFAEESTGVARLVGMDRSVAAAFIYYLTTDTIVLDATPELLMSLLVAAAQYDVPRLAVLAEARLIPLIDDDNVCGLLTFAHHYGAHATHLPAAHAEAEPLGPAREAGKPAPGGTLPRTPGATLRAACTAYLLRGYTRLCAHPDFVVMPEELQVELQALWAGDRHVYAMDRVMSATAESAPAALSPTDAA